MGDKVKGVKFQALAVGAFGLLLWGCSAHAAMIWTTTGDGTGIGTIDSATGVGTEVGPTGQSQGWAAAFDLNGTLFTTYNGFSGNAQLATVNTATGAIASTIGGLGTNLIALEVDASGQLWGVGYNDQNLYRIDKSTGAMVLVGNTGITSTMDLAFDSAGTLYSTVNNNLYTLDLFTGASTLLVNLTGILSGSVMGIMFDGSDVLYATNYVSGAELYTVNTSTGAATVVGETGFNFPHGGDIFISAVPEPGTLVLLGLGLAGLAASRRRGQ